MKRRTLVLAICLAFSTPVFSARNVLPSNTVGLNLGEIQSSSFLNEPFNGVIPILYSNKEAARTLKVRLAPHSIFSQVGAERLPLLEDLDFKVSIINNKPVISIRSSNSINLPFLNFILEIERKSGRKIYQDFTVMLDPRNLTLPHNIYTTTKHQKQIVLPATHSSPSLLSKGKQTKYIIRKGDSLFKIAHELKGSGLSTKRIIEGIRLKNLNSLNNINKIMIGKVINLPTFEELNNFSSLTEKVANKESKNSQTTVEAYKTGNIKYTIKKGDTLSKITKKHLYKGISFTKLMHAIFEQNRHAFSKNKINLLITDSVISIPTLSVRNALPKTRKTLLQTTNIQQEGTASKNKKSASKPIINAQELAPSSTDGKILQSNNKHIVESLQKRVRELRSQLTKVSNDFSNLENTINSNESLLQKQQNEVEQLKRLVQSFKEPQIISAKPDSSLLSTTIKNIEAEQVIPNETEVSIKTETQTVPEETSTTINKESTDEKLAETSIPMIEKEIIQSDTIDLEPTSLENTSFDEFTATTENSQLLSESIMSQIEGIYQTKGISYTLLFLLFGFLAVKLKKKVSSYQSIPENQPTYYKEDKYNFDKYDFNNDKYAFSEKPPEEVIKKPVEKEETALYTHKDANKEKKTNTSERIDPVIAQSDTPKGKLTQSYQDVHDESVIITNAEIEECEILVDSLLGELIEELEGGTASSDIDTLLNNDIPSNTSIESEKIPFSENLLDSLDTNESTTEKASNKEEKNVSTLVATIEEITTDDVYDDSPLIESSGSVLNFDLIDNGNDFKMMPEISMQTQNTTILDDSNSDIEMDLSDTATNNEQIEFIDDSLQYQSDLLIQDNFSQNIDDNELSDKPSSNKKELTYLELMDTIDDKSA